MVTTCTHQVSPTISLECRVSGQPGRPLLLFLHGFPEGAFIWDELLQHFAADYRCVAPNLRGYGRSSQPRAVADYRARYLIDDLSALIALENPQKQAACVIAHDWGGALAWGLANRNPEQMQRLLILNAPHPGAFLRELQHNAEQQTASQYMHFLRRPDAPQLLADQHWQRMLGFFDNPDGQRPSWLTPALQTQYRDHWSLGMHGACMYYAASPLVPPLPGADTDTDTDTTQDIRGLSLPDEMLHISVPVHILWGESDLALHPALLDGLEHWIPQLHIDRLPGTSHWVVHEQPERVKQVLGQLLTAA